jgi:arylsulfatase A-like enzyme
VLLVLIDDAGFDNPATFGGAVPVPDGLPFAQDLW